MIAFFKSFVYAVNGISAAVKERNLLVQAAIGLLVIVAGFYFNITDTEWCILLTVIALVMGFEMINTAIEKLVDLVTLERKPLAGKIKDIAAGAVLLVSIFAVIIGIIIFRKYMVS